jgi:hypothetical protein
MERRPKNLLGRNWGEDVAVELLIQDGSPDWWESPDIRVVPGTDPSGAAETPIVGKPAYLWATVRNEGDVDASQVQVDFWVANPSLQIRKSTANHIGTAFADVAAGSAQEFNRTAPGTPPFIAARTVGGNFVASAVSIKFDPSLPRPFQAQATIEVV